MESDKKTTPSYINIVLDNKPKYLEKLKEQATEDGQNEDNSDIEKLSIRDEGHTISPDEIYFEEGELHIAFNLTSKEGSTYVGVDVPLSQSILFDILGEGIKKFNKVRTVLEATK